MHSLEAGEPGNRRSVSRIGGRNETAESRETHRESAERSRGKRKISFGEDELDNRGCGLFSRGAKSVLPNCLPLAGQRNKYLGVAEETWRRNVRKRCQAVIEASMAESQHKRRKMI